MRKESVNVGVVGYGYWGPNLVRNFSTSASARVIAVSDLSTANLTACSRLYPSIQATPDFAELINNPEIDAIAIATPVNTHYDLALAALRAGKHVLVEKPMARTSDQVRRLIDEAERRKLVLMVDHTFLYTPAVQKIRALIAERAIGEIYYYDSIRSSLGLFQSDVNVIWDLAVHDLSIIHYIFDEEPVAVSATAVSHVSGSPENMAHLTLFFKSNCVAHISVNWLSPIKLRTTFVGGSRKMIVYDDLEPTEKIRVYDKGITITEASEKAQQLRIGYRAGDMWAPHIAAKEALQTEVDHFADCILNGTAPISSGRSGLQVVEVLEAACQSIAERGNAIRLRSDLNVEKLVS
jgi:predicted dehydrogenase